MCTNIHMYICIVSTHPHPMMYVMRVLVNVCVCNVCLGVECWGVSAPPDPPGIVCNMLCSECVLMYVCAACNVCLGLKCPWLHACEMYAHPTLRPPRTPGIVCNVMCLVCVLVSVCVVCKVCQMLGGLRST